MESRGLEDSKNVKTSQAYFFEGFISFFEDFSLTIYDIKKRIPLSSDTYTNTYILLTNTENIQLKIFL